MSRSVARQFALVLVCLLTATACADAKPDKKAATKPAETAWQRVLDEIQPDGTVTSATALKAFSLAYGRLPGVKAPAGPVGEVRSGTAALRWIAGHWNAISAEQRAAAVKAVPELGGGAAKTQMRISPAAFMAPKRPPTYYTVLAQQMADEIEARVKVPLTLKLRAAEGRTDANARADTGVYNASGGRTGMADRCVITVSAKGAADPLPDLESTIAHEVWHCYQGQIQGLTAFWSVGMPSWLIEGQAEWVGDSLRPTAFANFAWQPYVTLPGRPLFQRSYDAIGFYSHVTEAGLDTWSKLIPMLKAKDNLARYDAAVGGSEVFLDTWASTFFREPSYGPPWEMNGPSLPASRGAVRLVLSAANGKDASFKAAAYANAVFSLSSEADVLTFDVQGHARLADPSKRVDYVINSGGSYCTKNGGCACPEGSSYQGPPLADLAPESALAVTGGPSGTRGSASGVPLEEFCKKAESKLKLPDPCKVLTQSEASVAAGRAARPGFIATGTAEGLGNGTGCVYRDAATPSGTFGVAYVRLDVYDLGDTAAAQFKSYKKGFATLGIGQVKSMGDDNFYFCTDGCGPTHLYVRRANIVLHYAVLTGDGLKQATKAAKVGLGRL